MNHEFLGMEGKRGNGGKGGNLGNLGKGGKGGICRLAWRVVVGSSPVLRRQSASPQQSSNKFDSAFGSHDW